MVKLNKRAVVLFVLISCFHSLFSQEKPAQVERFFGFHFDFHATANDIEIGKYFSASTLEEFLKRTKPDFIQMDSKGHPGYSSYPTGVGYAPEQFSGDPLRQWRDVTTRLDLPLYVHYSGIWDDKAINEHPTWGRVNADGSTDPTKASVRGDYLQKLMIPQIKEMISRYDIDGIWVDGDCWSTGPDYSPEIVSAFLQSSQLKEVPRAPGEPGYVQWLDYNRQLFRDYLRQYVDELHQFKPTFQVASNWAYSSMMPEPVDVDVDFLSGDVSGQNCVYSAAFQARCLALQGKPWDLMAWGFVPMDFSGGIHSPKSAVQLKQEAAEVLSVGGGFQVYFQQNRDASFQTTIDVEAMVDLASFCRERQPFVQGSQSVPQVALWYSMAGWKKRNHGVYGWPSEMEGLNSLLLDGQHVVDITMDHHLQKNLEDYPLIVVPEWDAFDAQLKKRLMDHVANGASVLVIGAAAVREFEPWLGVGLEGEAHSAQFNVGSAELGGVTGIRSQWQRATAKPGTTTVGHIYHQRDYRFATPYMAGSITSHGKGKIGAIYFDLAKPYNESRHPVYNRLVDTMIKVMFPHPKLQVSGSDKIHATLMQKGGDLMVNLVNTNGPHFNGKVMGYDQIAPSSPLSVRLETSRKPKQVILQPANKPLKYTYDRDSGTVTVAVPAVAIHSILQFQNAAE